MKEAVIRCTCKEYTLSDLGLTLVQGESAILTDSQAQKSASLKLALRVGAVSIHWQEKCRMSKSPKPPAPPPFLRKGVRRVVRSPSMDENRVRELAAVEAKKAAKAAFVEAAEAAATQAAFKATQAATTAVKQVMREQSSTLAAEMTKAVEAGLSGEALQGAVQAALTNLVAAGGLTLQDVKDSEKARKAAVKTERQAERKTRRAERGKDEGPEEPIFIPEDLTTASGTTPTTTTTSTSSSSGLDDAAAALAAMGGGKKKRRRKTHDEES